MNRRTFLKLASACALTLGDDAMSTPSQAVPATGKSASLTVTAAQRANAVRNAARYAWAKAEQEAAIQAAQPWLERSDDTLWDLIASQELPRSIHVYSVFGTNKIALCPNCKEGIIPFGNYPWLTEVFARPWKIECPNCQ